MREIKYRIWDEKVKRYVQDEDWYYLSDDGELWNIYSYYYEMSKDLCDPERYIIEQYTGLKDKNGKEIYEGDVVRTHFSFGHEVTQEPFIIKWNKERAMFEGSKPIENDYLVTFSFFPEQRFLYEIIGNIHENPELLERR